MKGRLLCADHEKQVSDRSAGFNISRSDALDQLWQIRAEELANERAEGLEIAGDL